MFSWYLDIYLYNSWHVRVVCMHNVYKTCINVVIHVYCTYIPSATYSEYICKTYTRVQYYSVYIPVCVFASQGGSFTFVRLSHTYTHTHIHTYTRARSRTHVCTRYTYTCMSRNLCLRTYVYTHRELHSRIWEIRIDIWGGYQ